MGPQELHYLHSKPVLHLETFPKVAGSGGWRGGHITEVFVQLH